MKRLVVAILVLVLAALNARAFSSAAAAHPLMPRAAAKPVPVGPPLQPFAATGMAKPYVIGVPQHQRYPAGYTLTHMHPGNRYVFVISGSLQVTDAQGTRTYGPGAFFWETAWRVHTLHVLRAAETFALAFVPPDYTQRVTLPLK
jgi:hypothetical protein